MHDNDKDIIVISDDEDEQTDTGGAKNDDDNNDDAQNIAQRSCHHAPTAPAGPSRTRTNINLSPMVRHDSKRQKIFDGSRFMPVMPGMFKTEDDGAPGPAYPRAHLNFFSDEHGNTQAFPTFFDEAFSAGDLAVFNSPDRRSSPAAAKQNFMPKPPYTDHPTFRLRLYCGPGFEYFPVPVELNEEHKKICEQWDEKIQLKNERKRLQQTRDSQYGLYLDPSIQVEESEFGPTNDIISPAEEECMRKILEVLPDVDRDFVKEKVHGRYESYRFGDEEIEVIPDTDAIVAEIFELGDYPKAKIIPEREEDPFEKETGRTIQWDKNHTTNYHYTLDTVKLLAEQFDHVPTFYINKIMIDKRSLWDAYVHINDVETNYFQEVVRPYRRSKNRRTMIEKKYDRAFDPQGDPKYYASLINELQAAKQHVARETLKHAEEQQALDAERANIEKHRVEGQLLECQCCFDDEVPLNRSVSCRAICPHSFCYNCIKGLADSQVGLMRYKMLCMDPSGCKEKLCTHGVGRAIPVKTFDRLAFNEQQAEIVAAGIEGLEHCPFCEFKAICDPIEIITIFRCQNPDCFKVSCRKCHEISHLPKTCDEVKKERGLQARHKVEEARSTAMMRRCPKCDAKIIKDGGCNKMRCTCGTVLCYVCKLDLSTLRDGYEHFNKMAGKCPLYDKVGVDRHEQEANEAEEKAIAEVKTLDTTIEESSLQIETGKQKPECKPPPYAPRLDTRVHPYPMAPLLPLDPPVDQVTRLNELRGQVNQLRDHLRPPGRGRLGRVRRAAALAAVPPIAVPPRAVPNPFGDAGNDMGLHNHQAFAFGGGPRQLPIEQLDQNVQQWLQHANPGLAGPLHGPALNNVHGNMNDRDLVDAQERENNLRALTAADRIHNFRNDIARRRQSQAQRSDSMESDNFAELPTPGFFNMRQPVTPGNDTFDRQVNDMFPVDFSGGAGSVRPLNPDWARARRDLHQPPIPRTTRNRQEARMNHGDFYDHVRVFDGRNDQSPQLRRNQASIDNQAGANDDNRMVGRTGTQPSLVEQTLLGPADFGKGERHRGRQGSLDPDIGQPLHFQGPFGPQPQEAQRWITPAATDRAPPEAPRQGLNLLDSLWADRPQAHVQAHVQAPAHSNGLRLDGTARPNINTNANNLLHYHFDRPNPADPRLRTLGGKDNAYGVPWQRLN